MDSGTWPTFIWRLLDSLFFYPGPILCEIKAIALGATVDCGIMCFYSDYNYI